MKSKMGSESSPLVSVVIPVHNREDTIKRAIDSVLYQSYSNLELIIVDDGSTDHTLDIVRQYSDTRIRVVELLKCSGANVARNKGISYARGEYIAFQDSDDEWIENKIEHQIAYMVAHGFAAGFCAYNLIENDYCIVLPEEYSNKKRYEENLLTELTRHNVISTQTLVVRRDIVERLGGFDNEMPRLQDYEFVIRLVQQIPVGYVSEVLVNVYRTKCSISNDSLGMLRAVALLLEKHGEFLDVEAWLRLCYENSRCRDGAYIVEDSMMLQEALEKRNISSINAVQNALEYLSKKYSQKYRLQTKIYEREVLGLRTKEFAIYGAGKVAHLIYSELKERGIYPKCFLVTSNADLSSIDNVPVYGIGQWKDVNIKIIVGVSLEIQNVIVDTLLEQGYQRILCYPYS